MFEQAFKNIDDVLWKEAGCGSELDYAEQTSWLLFLKCLDGLEQDKSMEAQLESKQGAIVETLDALSDETQHLESIYQQKLVALDALKKSLLDQAFTGEL